MKRFRTVQGLIPRWSNLTLWGVVFGLGLPSAGAEEGSLGMITGARFDESTGQLFLTGSGEHPEATPSPAVIATAFQWVFPEGPRMPFVSIDPIPEDPNGPFMAVDIDPISRNTEFGWVMFEADRKMKCLGAGRDNVFGFIEDSAVPGFKNLLELGADHKAVPGAPPVWSRFWFVPLASEAQWDGDAIRIRDCRMGVKTEVMTMENGKLKSTNGKQDPAALAFAEHFTAHFREFGEEDPIYLRLEQQCRLILVADWLRSIRDDKRPLSLAWVRSAGGPNFPMPLYTPSVTSSREETKRDGNSVLVERLELFGGVDLSVKPKRVAADAGFADWKRDAITAALEPGRKFGSGPESLVASVLPMEAGPGFAGVVPETTLNVRLPGGGNRLEVRSRVSGLNPIPGEGGRELALPYLPSFKPKGVEGITETFQIAGEDASRIEARTYELLSERGEIMGVFDRHEVEQVSGEIQIRDSRKPKGDYYLSPDPANPNIMWAVQNGARRWAFSLPGGQIIADRRGGGDMLFYRYNDQNVLSHLDVANPQKKEPTLAVRFDHSPGGRSIVDAATNDGQSVSFRSETRLPSKTFEFTATNEGRQEIKMIWEKGKSAPLDREGKGLAAVGLEVIEPFLPELLAHMEGESSGLKRWSNAGYTILSRGGKVDVVSASEREFERGIAKLAQQADRLSSGGWMGRVIDGFFGAYTIVADARRSTCFHLSALVERLKPGHIAVSTDNFDRANKAIADISNSKKSIKVNVELVGELPGPAREALEPLIARNLSSQSGSDFTGANVKVVTGHMAEGTKEEIIEACRRSPGLAVIVLACNTELSPKASQEWADELVKNGAKVVRMPAGFLDAEDAAKILKAMESYKQKTTNILDWFNDILKSLDLQHKFGPYTAQNELLSPKTAGLKG